MVIFPADEDLRGRNFLDLHVSIDATIKVDTLTSFDVAMNLYDINVILVEIDKCKISQQCELPLIARAVPN